MRLSIDFNFSITLGKNSNPDCDHDEEEPQRESQLDSLVEGVEHPLGFHANIASEDGRFE